MDGLWSNQRVDLIVLQEAVGGFSGLFGYSPSIGAGNLIFSVAAVAGTDPYGNSYPAGISTTAGNSTIKGADYIIDNTGAFWYSGTPANGNLILSLANAAGTDPYGNTYPEGFGVAAGQIPGGLINSGSIPQGALSSAITARSLGGITTTISATAPGSPNTGDIWIDSANGNQLQQWDGSAWTAISWIASNVITAGSITTTLLNSSVTARALGGITTTISGTAPSGAVAGDIWINSASGYQINQYSGTAWVAVSWTATDVISAGTISGALIEAATITGSLIAAGTITASNIAANTITASQIAAGTITATQIAAATITGSLIAASTITGGNIAAGTITASNIQAGTITASLLVAGIVVAGIVDATTITGATISGGELIIGAAATGQVIITEDASSNGIIKFAAPSLTQYPEFHSKVVLWGTLPSTDDDVVEFTYIDQAGTEHVYGYMGGAYGFQIFAGYIAAPDPAHGTGPTDPAQQEVWHSLSPGSGFSGTCRYRMTPAHEVEIHLNATFTSTGTVTLGTLPVNYWPTSTWAWPVAQTGSTWNNVRADLTSGGVLTIRGMSSAGATYAFIQNVPLD